MLCPVMYSGFESDSWWIVFTAGIFRPDFATFTPSVARTVLPLTVSPAMCMCCVVAGWLILI